VESSNKEVKIKEKRRHGSIKVPYKGKRRRPPGKKKKRGKNQSPRNRKACPNIGSALLHSVAEIGTQSV
jgi:hypothetical protein